MFVKIDPIKGLQTDARISCHKSVLRDETIILTSPIVYGYITDSTNLKISPPRFLLLLFPLLPGDTLISGLVYQLFL